MDTKVLSSGVIYTNLPESYVRPESDRPRLSEVSGCENIPVIDLASPNRAQTVQQIGDACKYYGCFQVINHGVSTEGMEKMVGVANEFFNLPVEEKLKLYSDDPSKTMRLSTSFDVNKEKVHREIIFAFIAILWTSTLLSGPPILRPSGTVSNYCREVRELGYRLEESISESLGLEKDYIKNTLGEQGQHMAVNFYPPCPQPELTYGLPGRTDPNSLTILLQDLGVAGLQVLKDGKRVAVDPQPNALVINIGDQLQAPSNGTYKSVLHRAVTNTEKARLSVASSLCSQDDGLINPANARVGEEELPVEASTEGSGTQGLAVLAQLSVLLRYLARVSVLLNRIISAMEWLDGFALICPQVSVVKEFLLPKLLTIQTIVDSVVSVLKFIKNVSKLPVFRFFWWA